MHLVNDNLPHRCAVTLRTSDDDGFIAIGHVLSGWDPEIEVSVAGAKELGRFLGMVPPEDIADLEAQVREKLAECELLRDRVEKLEQIHALTAEVAA